MSNHKTSEVFTSCAKNCLPGQPQKKCPETCNEHVHFLHYKIITRFINSNPTSKDNVLKIKT